ncbi:MAG TPA: peptidyl-prolyl cis-trans isomerase [Kiritimatiellia bacterium]|nr:peptidyl-prolyl cis-trans isomerase [Kiritimatiellia bacterium]HRZ12613.1 peptidyl-prolyl cis-trans isomerase [Kiritimatiellia bacterium]HSA17691.1 peptidyl-prolyl cis-trans isomerase [Kiritimatiellia bacterium]
MKRMRGMLGRMAAAWLAWAASAGARSVAVDGYAAMVNQRVILRSEVFAMVYPLQQKLKLEHSGAELEKKLEEAYTNVLESLIERALIVEEFNRQGHQLPDRAIDTQVNSLISERFNNNRMAFLDALAEERLTLAEWREQAKDGLIVTILRRTEILDRVAVAPRQVREYYEKNLDRYRTPEEAQLRLIVLHPGATPEERAAKIEEARRIRERLAGGEDFATVAKTASEGPKAAQGGDMGWMQTSELRAELAAGVKDLEPGQLSEVIEASDEIYLAKVEGRKQAAVTSFQDARQEIEEQLHKQEMDRLYDAWIARLKNRFYVKVF